MNNYCHVMPNCPECGGYKITYSRREENGIITESYGCMDCKHIWFKQYPEPIIYTSTKKDDEYWYANMEEA